MVKVGEGYNCQMPKMYLVEKLDSKQPTVELKQMIESELERPAIRERFVPGSRIAVGLGSRGISRIKDVAQILIGKLKEWGVHPFIVPAMGSHGNALAKGQIDYLAGYDITEESMGVPIVSSLEVVKLAEIEDFESRIPVYFDRVSVEADGIVIINRIKPHTDFRGPIESGLLKMLAIGLGNHEGATALHMFGSEGLKRLIPAAGELILKNAPVILGLGIVENFYKEPLCIKALLNEDIASEEKKMLELARNNMPCLPAEDVDVLVVDEMGKDISGPGLDTNVIGRFLIRGLEDPPFPKIKRIAVLALSKKTGGNAAGIGLADFVTRSLIESVDMDVTYTNCITSNFVERAFIPMIAENDREAIELSLKSSRGWDTGQARVIRIKNTLTLQRIEVSESIWKDLNQGNDYRVIAGPYEWDFSDQGKLK